MFNIEVQQPKLVITLEGDSVNEFKAFLVRVKNDDDVYYRDRDLSLKILKEMGEENVYDYDY